MKTKEQAVAEKGAWVMESGMDEITKPHYTWTIQDEAIHRGINYAEANEKIIAELRRDEGVRLHAILKNAYQEGFLHGFEHKFDDHNYQRQTDMVSECPTKEEK